MVHSQANLTASSGGGVHSALPFRYRAGSGACRSGSICARPAFTLRSLSYAYPNTFAGYGRIGRGLGFNWIKVAPLVRSSHHADKIQYPS